MKKINDKKIAKKVIEEEILMKGLRNNWYSYNNFECSISWKVIN